MCLRVLSVSHRSNYSKRIKIIRIFHFLKAVCLIALMVVCFVMNMDHLDMHHIERNFPEDSDAEDVEAYFNRGHFVLFTDDWIYS